MKKILALAAFIVLGFTATYAQTTPAPAKKTTTPATVAPVANTPAPAAAAVAVEEVATVNSEVKKDAKKECTTDEKKACGTKAGKKSCCSHKD